MADLSGLFTSAQIMSDSPRRFFGPGIALMQRLPMAVKLFSMAALLVLPMLAMVLLMTQSLWEQRLYTQKELAGLAVVNRISEVVALTQKHRGQTHLILAGETALQQGRDATQHMLHLDGENTRQLHDQMDTSEWVTRFSSSLLPTVATAPVRLTFFCVP